MRVHFFQPNQFNRTERKTNPFFDPIVTVCERECIPYRVFCAERHRSESGYGAKWGNSWILFLAEVLALRCVKWFKVSPQRSYRVWGWMANLLTFGYYRADICITVAGMHLEILQGVAPKARLVDLQHGIICMTHTGYFGDGGVLLPILAQNRQREFWLYGEGYRQSFLKNPANAAVLKGRLHIIGDVLGCQRDACLYGEGRPVGTKDALVFSLQFTNSLSQAQMATLSADMVQVLERVEAEGLHRRYQVLLKHHPRYAGCFDLTGLYRRFPWAKETMQQTQDLIRRAAYHLTAYSTTAFEYAAAGVPTLFFWDDELNPEGRTIFLEEYAYPLGAAWKTMTSALDSPEEARRQAETVKAWYRRFYASFDEEQCLRLLTGVR